MSNNQKGFTLIELLVLIGIIAALSAVLFPLYVNAKKSAKRAACQSNLRQIGQAFESYLADNNSYYPNTDYQYLWAGYYWREPMRRYVGAAKASGAGTTKNSVFSCPSDPTPPGIYAATSYAYSAAFYMTPAQVNAVADNNHLRKKFEASNPRLPCTSMRTSDVRYPSKKIMVAEYWTLHSENAKVGWYDTPEEGGDPWSGARNCLFADSHVKYVLTKQIRPAVSPVVDRPRSLPDINLTRDGIAGKDID